MESLRYTNPLSHNCATSIAQIAHKEEEIAVTQRELLHTLCD